MLEVHTPGNVYIASFLIQVHGKNTQSVIFQTITTTIYFFLYYCKKCHTNCNMQRQRKNYCPCTKDLTVKRKDLVKITVFL